MVAIISIGVDPNLHLGPVTLAWHGLTIAIGLLIGGVVAAADARRRGLDGERVSAIGGLAIVGAIIGGRAFYLAEHGGLGDPAGWFGDRGFTFYGGFLGATAMIAVYLWRQRLSVRYLDALALGLALGYAVGRVGDIINGEHYGPQSDFFLAVRNTHPDADVPRSDVAYHNGGLYEALIGLIVFALALTLRTRLTRPTQLAAVVVGLFAVGRFAVFLVRSDAPGTALGLESAQWVSLALLMVAVGWLWQGLPWVSHRAGFFAEPRPDDESRTTTRQRSRSGHDAPWT